MDEQLIRKEPVEYTFECASVSSNWRVLDFHCHQRVNHCYQAKLILVGEGDQQDPQPMMGQRVSLHLAQGAALQSFGGIVREVELIGRVHGHALLRLEFVPALALCKDNLGARVCQGRSTLQIVQDLFGPMLESYGSGLELGQGSRGRDTLDFRVQYDESDFAFGTRLLAQAGINFVLRYDHDKEAEVMVLFDQLLACPFARNLDGRDCFPYHPTSGGFGELETVQAFAQRHVLVSTQVKGARWDWSLPHCEVKQERGGNPFDNISSYDPKQYREDHQGLTRRIQDQSHRRANAALKAGGTSCALGLGIAKAFELSEHPDEAMNERYVVTEMIHEGRCFDLGLSSKDLAEWIEPGPRYQNRFSCIPEGSTLLPEALDGKARVHGPMTALVCGPEPGQVHVDEHGRIQLRFHWDLETPPDQPGSCWVRVAQGWSGDGFGLNFIPRVGSEVMVEFLQGDPEQPVVTGSLPNRATPSPFSLPMHKHQSGVRTQSSDGAIGHNELRFDDQRGQEEVYLRAQETLKVEVLGNKVQSVGGDHVQLHGANERIEVLGDRSLSVRGRQITQVQGAEHQQYQDALIQDIGAQGWRSMAQGAVHIESQSQQTFVAQQGFDLCSISGGAQMKLADRFLLSASQVEIQCGNTRLSIDASGAVSLHAKGQPISIQGSKIQLNSK